MPQEKVLINDACPPDVIQRFVNRSWIFVPRTARLTGNAAAAWAAGCSEANEASREAVLTVL